jgi:hypothetical protein
MSDLYTPTTHPFFTGRGRLEHVETIKTDGKVLVVQTAQTRVKVVLDPDSVTISDHLHMYLSEAIPALDRDIDREEMNKWLNICESCGQTLK